MLASMEQVCKEDSDIWKTFDYIGHCEMDALKLSLFFSLIDTHSTFDHFDSNYSFG